jgi:hypothetical protein
LSRISSSFRAFFAILFGGSLPEDIANEFGYAKPKVVPPAPKIEPPKATDGALQLLGILQRDARLIDFIMEDIDGYGDDQVGAAARSVHSDCRATITRHFKLASVIDSVEGTFQKLDANKAPDPNRIKLVGNVPATGKSRGGTLRHKGWIAESVTLPAIGKQDVKLIVPAEIEVE